MKFLHISDLHIGKRVHEFSMINDQKYILGKILAIAENEEIDGIFIAGDVYDKPAPSAEAVQLFDWFLTGLAGQKRKVFVVSGNHDCVERLSFGAQIMAGQQVYVSTAYDGNAAKIELEDEYGKLAVYLLPFVKPAIVNHALEMEERPLESYQDALRAVIGRMELDDGIRNILVAHQFVTGAGRCESENVSVGGLDNVDADVFDGFDYVALGHIHSPQWIGRETLRYCGTPLKYSFSESEQQKSAVILECGKKGDVRIRMEKLTPLHDMQKIRGSYLEVTARKFYEHMDTEDYFQITLTDENDIPQGLAKLRVIYPNLMQLLYDNSRTKQNQAVTTIEAMERKSPLDLFEEFFKLQNNQPMSDKQRELAERFLKSEMDEDEGR